MALTYFVLLLLFVSCTPGNKETADVPVQKVAIDTMNITSPYIIYDKSANLYYMTGDGGAMWHSRDMQVWEGPFDILQHSEESWMGATPKVLSPEIHKYKDKYYYMATFTSANALSSEEESGTARRTSCEVFVGDKITGPYKHISQGAPLLSLEETSEHPTFCTDEYNVGYLIYNRNWADKGDATVQIIRLGRKLDTRVGEPYIMFRASQNPWASDCLGYASPYLASPFFFETLSGQLGILFTSVEGGEKAIGVAYSETGHLDGPWIIEPQPLLVGNVSNAMLFKDYDGKQLMAYQKDTVIDGKPLSQPRFMRVDTQFDKLKLKGHYKF